MPGNMTVNPMATMSPPSLAQELSGSSSRSNPYTAPEFDQFVTLERPEPGAWIKRGGSRRIPEGQEVTITVKKMIIRNLLSKDMRKKSNRNGVVTFQFHEGEGTSSTHSAIRWKKEGGTEKVFNYDQVIYYGQIDPHRPLDLQVMLTESDEKQRKTARFVKDVFGTITTAAAAVPVFGHVTAAVSNTGRLVAEAFQDGLKDDLELFFRGGLRVIRADSKGSLPEGRYTIKRLARKVKKSCLGGKKFTLEPDPDAPPDIEIVMELMYLRSDRIMQISQPYPRVRIYLHRLITKLKGRSYISRKTFMFDASFGRGEDSKHFKIQAPLTEDGNVRNILAIQNCLMYEGPLGVGIPFNVQASMAKTEMVKHISRFVTTAASAAGAGLQVYGHAADENKYQKIGNQVAEFTRANESMVQQSTKTVADQFLNPSGAIAMRTGILTLLKTGEEFVDFTGDAKSKGGQMLFDESQTSPTKSRRLTNKIGGILDQLFEMKLYNDDNKVSAFLKFQIIHEPVTDSTIDEVETPGSFPVPPSDDAYEPSVLTKPFPGATKPDEPTN